MAEIDQNTSCYAGEVFSLRFPILNSDGTAATFATPVGSWALGTHRNPIDGETPLILKTTTPASGARIMQEAINSVQTWVLYVDFAQADTENIAPGVHYHEARIVDGANVYTVAIGKMTIYPTIIREA